MKPDISLKSHPAIGRYRLYSDQQKSCTFFDARDRFEAKRYAIGSIGLNSETRAGTLTDLDTGEVWRIQVEIVAVEAVSESTR